MRLPISIADLRVETFEPVEPGTTGPTAQYATMDCPFETYDEACGVTYKTSPEGPWC